MKRKLVNICMIVLLILDPWIVSLIHCEILTAKYSSDELIAVCEENDMIGEVDTLKVLEQEPLLLKVYVKNEQGGHVMWLEEHLSMPQKQWKVVYWWVIWSKEGSANEIIWPYIR